MVDDRTGPAKGKTILNFVPSMATAGEFMAPDSTARRPAGERLDDRPRTPGQTYPSALSADLDQNEENEK